jgi:hypothetical protein
MVCWAAMPNHLFKIRKKETKRKEIMEALIEKHNKLKKNSSISIRPYTDESMSNMGLEKYNMVLFENVYHEEPIIYLDPTGNGKRRYITGLNEFAPELNSLGTDEKEAKIKDIRECVARIETYFGNPVKPTDPDFWSKVVTARPDNYSFWDKIKIRVSNEPVFLDPAGDIYDLIKVKAIEAGGFSLVSKSLDDIRQKGGKVKFYLDKFEETISVKTEVKKLTNEALAELHKLYKGNIDKLFLVCKVIDPHSVQYKKNTPIDVFYENMDLYINGKTVDVNKKKTAQHFLDVASSDMETLKLRAIIKDANYYRIIAPKGDGYLYHIDSNSMMGKNPSDVVEYLKNPLNEDLLKGLIKIIEGYWNE